MDFEQYAMLKPFNFNVASTWEKAFWEVMEATGLKLGEAKFLDYGCGDGKYFPYLVKRGGRPENIYGVEVSKIRVERCHAQGWYNVFLLSKGEKLPFPDNFFDVVNLMEVIEHIPETETDICLREIQRVMKSSGVLILSTPNYPIKRFYDLYDAFILGKRERLRDDPTHVTLYTHKRLIKLLGGYFSSVQAKVFKPGFLYKRFKVNCLVHKMLMICSGMAVPKEGEWAKGVERKEREMRVL